MSCSRPQQQNIFAPFASDSDISTDDDKTFAGEEDQPLVLNDEASVATSSSVSSALPLNARKQFAIDIQANGGLDNFSLAKLAEEKKVYGLPNSKQRRVYGNLAQRWKKGQRAEYNSFLLKPDSAFLSPDRGNRTTRTPSSSTRRASTRRRQQQSPAPSPASASQPQSPPAVQRTAASPRAFQPHPSILLAQRAPTMANQFAANLLNMPHTTIRVNLEFPERHNGPFFITEFCDHVHNGLLYNGYQIRHPDVDLRQLTGNQRPAFQAWHLGGPQVMVQVPSADPTFMNNAQAYTAGMRAANYNRPRVMEVFNVARNEILGNEDCQSVYYLLIFEDSQPHGLNNSIFSAGLANNRLLPKVIPLVSTFQVQTANGPANVTSQRADILWDIAMVEPFPRQVAEAQPQGNDLTAQLELSLGALGLTTEQQRQAWEREQQRRAFEEQRQAEQHRLAAEQRALEEQQRRAAEEAQRRAAEEAQRRAAEEAQRALEEQQRRTAEEAQRALDAEEQRRAAKEAQSALDAERRAAEEQQHLAEQGANGVGSIAYAKFLEKKEFQVGQETFRTSTQARRRNTKEKKLQKRRGNVAALLQPPSGKDQASAQAQASSSLQVAAQEGRGTADPFMEGFAALMENPSEAWREQEEQVDLQEGEQANGSEEKQKDGEEEKMNMLASDED